MSSTSWLLSTRFMAALVTLTMLAPIGADAETGDTHISIDYRAKSVRVRPTPRNGGGDVHFGILLRANGKIEDEFSVKDGQSGSTKSKIGPKSRGAVVYRVLDAGTITRTTDLGTHLHKMTIRTSGKDCTANVEYILKPGEKEYRDYSTELKQMAYYSSLEMASSTCTIK